MKTLYTVLLSIALFFGVYAMISFLISLIWGIQFYKVARFEPLAAVWLFFGSVGMVMLADEIVDEFYY